MTEKQFENQIKKLLKSHNMSHNIWFTKIWGGGFQKAGIPDLLCCINGKFVAIELKADDGQPTELQKYNIRKINECNGIGLILYPENLQDFKDLVETLLESR